MSELFKVMFDPGHGGSEPGAVNKYTREADINLIVAKAAKNYIEQRSTDFKVELTRYQDTTMDRQTRCAISNSFGSDLFMSIHHNAGGGDGFEVYHYTGSEQGAKLANLLAEEFTALDQNKRFVGSGLYAGTKPGNYDVLALTDAPAVLGEFGFMDTKDYTQFDEEEELIKIGHGYGRAAMRFFNYKISDEQKPTILPTISERLLALETAILEVSESQKVINDLLNNKTINDIVTALRTIK